VRAAVSYIHANFGESVRLANIAHAANVHERNLQIAFLDSLGVSPMSYLRNVRLDVARYWLFQPIGRPTVSDVAYGSGYTHLGRFSTHYRARFGELPSETIAKTTLETHV